MAYSEEQWAECKQKCRLNDEDIALAKRLGLNPRSLIKNIPDRSETWKAPVKDWLREMEAKRDKKANQNMNIITLDSEIIYSNPWLRLIKNEVCFPNGSIGEYTYVHHQIVKNSSHIIHRMASATKLFGWSKENTQMERYR